MQTETEAGTGGEGVLPRRHPKRTCLALGTITRCCTMSVWQTAATRVKASWPAESLHTRSNRALVCCFVSSFLRHSSVTYGIDSRPSS